MTPTPESTMPALEGAQRAQADAMRAALRERIAERGGWIGFDEYLEQVLYAPGLGYYSAGAVKLGARGRFHHGTGDLTAVRRLHCQAVRSADGRGRLSCWNWAPERGALAEVMLVRLAAASAAAGAVFNS